MSLQVWLPLDGDLRNQGLSDAQVINNGATVNNNGKIGKCYFNNSSNYCTIPININSKEPFSLCFWYRIDTWSNWGTAITLNDNSDTYIGMCPHSNGQQIGTNWYEGSTKIYDQYHSQTITVGVWYHISIIVDKTSVKTFINGIQTSANSNYSNAPTKNFTQLTLFKRGTASTFGKNSLNDVRVYSHALSVKEIKELAKGLVLHYPLDNLINDTVYDCSGYLRHAIKTEDVVSSNNTPRYSSCSHFRDYDANIESSINLAFLNTGSCSFWAKVNIPGDMGFLPVAADSTHYFMATDLGNFSNQNIGTNTIKYYEDGVEVVKPTSFGVWHHYVITGINLSTWNTLRINNCTSTWNSPDVLYSDFRLYNTILSADDVKALYNDSASIDKNGNFHAYEYVEDNNIINVDINKQGVFTVPEEIMENSLKEPSIDDENIYAKGGFYED